MNERNINIPEVQVIFKRGNKILLNLRQNTGYMDGWYWLIAWHVEKGETFSDAALREAFEEAWVQLKKESLQYVHTVHRVTWEGMERVGVIFIVEVWPDEPYNAESEKCKQLLWCDIDILPENTIPYLITCIWNIQRGLWYTETNG